MTSHFSQLPKEPDWRHRRLRDFADGCLLVSGSPLASVAQRCSGLQVYLATPFSKIVVDDAGRYDPALGQWAALDAGRWAGACARHGMTAVSPIVQAVAMLDAPAGRALDPLDQDFWESWCAPMLAASQAVLVPDMVGWDQSIGVWHEVRVALMENRRVYLMGELPKGGV